MSIEYHISTLGSDDNSGSSESVIIGGTGAATDGSSTVQLPAGTNLSAVNQGVSHDTVRIAGRSDGVHGTDIFEITAIDEGAITAITYSFDQPLGAPDYAFFDLLDGKPKHRRFDPLPPSDGLR